MYPAYFDEAYVCPHDLYDKECENCTFDCPDWEDEYQ